MILKEMLADPVATLVSDGVLQFAGWQLPTAEAPWLWRGVHPHFFDEWADDLIDFHVGCNPVFVRVFTSSGGHGSVMEQAGSNRGGPGVVPEPGSGPDTDTLGLRPTSFDIGEGDRA